MIDSTMLPLQVTKDMVKFGNLRAKYQFLKGMDALQTGPSIKGYLSNIGHTGRCPLPVVR